MTLSLTAHAQQAGTQLKIDVTIVDENGEALPGATVKASDKSLGVVSDAQGKVSLWAAKGATKVFSRWDPKVGWVSTSRMAAKGGTGFRMASFGWERAKKASVTAPYSNQLANLWHRETDPYMRNSPIVGRPGKLTMWREGARRPVRYNWSTAYNILASVEDVAIARTEKQFQPKLDKEVFK